MRFKFIALLISIEFISSLGQIIVFMMLLFAVFLFTVKSKNQLANRIFSIFLLITAFDLSGLFLGEFIRTHFNFAILKTSSVLLQMPLFYLYVLAVCYSDFKLNSKHALHALMFFFFVYIFKISSFSEQSLFYFRIVGELQYFAYIILIFYSLSKYRTIYLENYAKADRSAYKWLFQITLYFCFAHLFVLLKTGALMSGIGESYLKLLYLFISSSALIIICWFVLKALYNPHLFTGIKSELEPLKAKLDNKELVAERDMATLSAIESLAYFMERKKPYLDYELTLEKLANQLKMEEKDLSILINHHLGKHFFDFINEYRIEEAKKILRNPENKKLTILEVLYQVGFNSKSSFYTAFKKITDQTPTAYRKSALAE